MNAYYVFIKTETGSKYVVAQSRYHAHKTATRAKAKTPKFIAAVCIAVEDGYVQDIGYIGEASPRLYADTNAYVSRHGYARA